MICFEEITPDASAQLAATPTTHMLTPTQRKTLAPLEIACAKPKKCRPTIVATVGAIYAARPAFRNTLTATTMKTVSRATVHP